MCKFHRDVAVNIARDPATGKISDLHYSIATAALARFWIDRHLPDHAYLSGNSHYEMAAPEAQAAFKKSSLCELSDASIDQDRAKFIPLARSAIDAVIDEQKLNLKSLGVGSPRLFPRYMNQIMEDIYKGVTTSARELKPNAPHAWQQPISKAVTAFYQKPGLYTVIETLIDGSIAGSMRRAPEMVSPRLQDIYNRMPVTMRSAFGACAHGAGGAVAGHLVCGASIFASGSLGAAAGPAMYIAAPVIAGGIGSVSNYRVNKPVLQTRLAVVAAFGMAVAAGINHWSGHDHASGHGPEHHEHQNGVDVFEREQAENARRLYAALPKVLQTKVDKRAADLLVDRMQFLTQCGSDPVSIEVMEFARNRVETGRTGVTASFSSKPYDALQNNSY